MNSPIITISNLHISFKNNEILKNINLDINKGDFIYLIGETGSGKSSLLKALYKGIDFQKGSISVGEFNLHNIKNNQIAHLRRHLGIIFQDFQLLSDRNIYKNLEFVLHSTGWKDKNWKGKLFARTENVSKCPVSFLFKKKKPTNHKGFK